jgi:hypothetical protein
MVVLRVEGLRDGVGGALECGGACAECGLADECAEVLGAGRHFGRAGGVVGCARLLGEVARGAAERGLFCKERVRHCGGCGVGGRIGEIGMGA